MEFIKTDDKGQMYFDVESLIMSTNEEFESLVSIYARDKKIGFDEDFLFADYTDLFYHDQFGTKQTAFVRVIKNKRTEGGGQLAVVTHTRFESGREEVEHVAVPFPVALAIGKMMKKVGMV